MLSAQWSAQLVDLATVNSWSVDPGLMWQVAVTVADLAARDDVAGVVVTHGTDTLEETAFLVDLLVDTDKPVVFTAAMRSADDPSPDGPHNLRSALRVACSPLLHGRGAVVCLDDQLHAARWVRKGHTHSAAAFASFPARTIGCVDPEGSVRRTTGALPRWTLPTALASGPPPADDVPVVQAYSGMSAEVLDAVVAATRPRGIVLEGFGQGHLPASVVAPIRALVDEGVVVAVATRVPAGGTWATYGGPGGGTDLAARGVCRAGDLSAAKARLLLLACLAGRPPATARTLFDEAVAVLGRGAER